LKEVQKRREGDFGTALDASRVGDSDSNGTIEAAIQGVEGMARTVRFGLEAKIKKKISIDNPVMPWLIRHSGHLMTRCWIRPGGRTAYQLIKGRKSNAKLIEFGEAVLFRVPHTKTRPGKFEEMWEFGGNPRWCVPSIGIEEEAIGGKVVSRAVGPGCGDACNARARELEHAIAGLCPQVRPND
jgi:hypothetical protein